MNKRTMLLVIHAVLLPAVSSSAAPRCETATLLNVEVITEYVPSYQAGKIEERRKSNGNREWTTFTPPPARKHTEYRVSVEMSGMIYTARSSGDWWGYDPTELVINDPIEACTDGRKLILTRPDGRKYKPAIVRAERTGQATVPVRDSSPRRP